MAYRVLVIAPDSGSFGDPILRGICAWLRTRGGWSTTLCNQPRQAAGWSGDGALVPAGAAAELRAVIGPAIPIVRLCGADPDDPLLVMHDHAAIGALAARTFLERGHRRFAMLDDPGKGHARQRLAGFAGAIAAAGYAVETWSGVDPQRLAAAQREAGRPLAVFACTDRLGLAVLDACRSAGLAVPGQIAVLGVDNDVTRCEFADPPLASIDAATELMGWHGADLLDQRLRNQRLPSQARLVPPGGVVMRRSADVTAVDDTLVAQALTLIAHEACNGLEAGQLAVRLRCGRRTLETRFRLALGRSPLQAITERRLARARQLLADGDDPLDEVARRCGWATAAHLVTVFRRAEGVPPGAYRRLRRSPGG